VQSRRTLAKTTARMAQRQHAFWLLAWRRAAVSVATSVAQIMSINGKYPGWQPKSLPAVPGLEGTLH